VKDWNIVVTTYQEGFRRALRALQDIGPAERGPFHNVLVMKVDDPMAVLEAIERITEERPALYDAIARVAPAMRAFEFSSAETFKDNSKSIVLEWLPSLAGTSFHARLHRRGPKLELRTPDVERFLNDVIIEAAAKAGLPGSISFTDPDAVIVIDTVDDRAGIAIWTREDIARHRLLRPD
jgi:tRNA(Ser,Leu) C12 N-acetylase TAN1